MPYSLAALVFALVALTPSVLAQATQEERETRAQELFDQGRALYEQHQLAAAVEAFVESDRLSPTPNNAFNIAQTYELMGRYEDAFNWYQRCLARDAASADSVSQRESALLDRIAVVDATLSPPGAELQIDGVALEYGAQGTWSTAVPAGEHRVGARAAGRQPRTMTIEAVRGQRVSVQLDLPPAEGRLTVDSTPRGALVLRPPGHEPLGHTPLSVSMPPQELHLVLRLDGYRDREALVRVDAEHTAELALTLQRRTPAVGSPGGASSRHGTGLGGYRWVGYGAAAALFATGVGLGIAAIEKKNEVEKDPLRRDRDEVDRMNLAADLTGSAGLLTALATLALDIGILGIGPIHAD
jgi:tetratricopeptide (TPR) repeat protein